VDIFERKRKLRSIDLFSGIGGITNALEDWCEPIMYCEKEPFAQSVLLSRMQKGDLPKAPIWDDITTLQAGEFGEVDLICGGSPCQDISVAGHKKGLEGERSGLVSHIFRLADETKAPFIFLENVPNIRLLGAETVCKEFSKRGYDIRWCMLSARDVGAPHKRERFFLLAYKNSVGDGEKELSDSEKQRLPGKQYKERWPSRCGWWETEPDLVRVANGLPSQNDRIKALGNSVVPQCVKEAFKILAGLS